MLQYALIIGGLFMGVNYIKNLPSINFNNYNAFNAEIKQASEKYGVPYLIIKAMIATESGFNPNAEAKTSSARGLMQMTKGACIDVGATWENMLIPADAIDAGTAYLARMVRATGSYTQGVRAYYEGLGNRLKNSDNDPTNDNIARRQESAEYLEKVERYKLAMTLYG